MCSITLVFLHVHSKPQRATRACLRVSHVVNSLQCLEQQLADEICGTMLVTEDADAMVD